MVCFTDGKIKWLSHLWASLVDSSAVFRECGLFVTHCEVTLVTNSLEFDAVLRDK
jgi:hypothetical protein